MRDQNIVVLVCHSKSRTKLIRRKVSLQSKPKAAAFTLILVVNLIPVISK